MHIDETLSYSHSRITETNKGLAAGYRTRYRGTVLYCVNTYSSSNIDLLNASNSTTNSFSQEISFFLEYIFIHNPHIWNDLVLSKNLKNNILYGLSKIIIHACA